MKFFNMQLSDAKNLVESLSAQEYENPFSDSVLQFCQILSENLLNNKELRHYGDLIALGFWFRKSHLEQLKQQHFSGNRLLRPRGLAFHITPGNVDVMFAYSWLLSLLAGNNNIVRLSSRNNETQRFLLEIIEDLLTEPQYESIKNGNIFVKYGHDSDMTEYFSSLCDIRVIWGGDKTIDKIRQSAFPATAKEIVFADRFSFSLIDAQAILATEKLDSMINAFLKDVFIFSQQACSSPRMIVWLGEQSSIAEAKTIFWHEIANRLPELRRLNDLSTPEHFDKMVICQYLAAQGCAIDLSLEPYVHRIQLQQLEPRIQHLHHGNGLVYELSIARLEELSTISNKHFQTCSYYGLDPEYIRQLVVQGDLENIHRYVPLGQALEFTDYWDGMDLLYEFSQVISIS